MRSEALCQLAPFSMGRQRLLARYLQEVDDHDPIADTIAFVKQLSDKAQAPIGIHYYTEARKYYVPNLLSGQEIYKTFGSWEGILQAAGLVPGSPPRRFWPRAELAAALLTWGEEGGQHDLTEAGYDSWRDYREELPSSFDIRIGYLTWPDACAVLQNTLEQRIDAQVALALSPTDAHPRSRPSALAERCASVPA
jgi:hypothetical protein